MLPGSNAVPPSLAQVCNLIYSAHCLESRVADQMCLQQPFVVQGAVAVEGEAHLWKPGRRSTVSAPPASSAQAESRQPKDAAAPQDVALQQTEIMAAGTQANSFKSRTMLSFCS